MLSWFKKKFGKKETDQQPSEADLKIPVAPRPGSTVVEELADLGTVADSPDLEKIETAEPPPVADEIEMAAIAPVEDDAEPATPSSPGQPAEDQEPPVAEPASVTDAEGEPLTVEQDAIGDADLAELLEQEIGDQPGKILPAEAEESGKRPEEPGEILEQADRQAVSAVAGEQTEVASGQPEVPATKTVEARPAVKKKSFLSRLSERLSRTRESFTYQLDTLFLGRKEIDAKLLDDLEELLITADLGMKVTMEVLDHARRKLKRKELSDPQSLKLALKAKLRSFIEEHQQDASLVMPEEGPFVIMVVGVNGVGKTTTIGKIAHKFLRSGQSVLLVAADTFRAAAVSQLKIWGERNQVPVIAKEEGADPSAVVYDGIAHAKAKGYDVVLVDTAGRLHTQSKLMEELKKIKRVMGKQLEGAPHEVMLVIDATTGQNGISQAKLFNEAVALTGITLTKLDGTAKGGIVINIGRELQLPIRFIGVGEQLDDLRDFDPDEFIEALFQSDQTRT